MKWVYIFFMAYMSVSGGPFGIEETLQKIPLYQTLGILLFASLAHLLPTMIMTYEMIQKYDQHTVSGGTIGWVEQTMGKNVGLLNAVYNIIDTAVDNAVYPVIIKDNLGVDGPIIPFVFCVMCAVLNWNGTEFTGKITILQSIIILLPFIYLIWATPIDDKMYIDRRTYGETTFESYQEVLMIMIWNLSGFDMCASYIHTLKASEKDMKISFGLTSITTIFFYIACICCGSRYLHSKDEWYDGSWSHIGDMLWGDFGKTTVQVASIVSSVSTLCVELCATSYLWMGLVNLGAAPSLFKNYKFNLAVNTALTIILSTTQPFDVLVETSALLNVSTIIFESIAWIKTFGYGMWYGRLFVAFVLVATNLCVSMCISPSCVAALLSATVVALIWTGISTLIKRRGKTIV